LPENILNSLHNPEKGKEARNRKYNVRKSRRTGVIPIENVLYRKGSAGKEVEKEKKEDW